MLSSSPATTKPLRRVAGVSTMSSGWGLRLEDDHAAIVARVVADDGCGMMRQALQPSGREIEGVDLRWRVGRLSKEQQGVTVLQPAQVRDAGPVGIRRHRHGGFGFVRRRRLPALKDEERIDVGIVPQFAPSSARRQSDDRQAKTIRWHRGAHRIPAPAAPLPSFRSCPRPLRDADRGDIVRCRRWK